MVFSLLDMSPTLLLLLLVLEGVFLADEMLDDGWMFRVDSVFSLNPAIAGGIKERANLRARKERAVSSSSDLFGRQHKTIAV